jgi:hypothetical protein
MDIDLKSLYYEADTRKHQQLVAEKLIVVAKKFMDRAIVHDASKFDDVERSFYEEPVFLLNTDNVEYGSERYKELTARMGEGWDHHKNNNDHHPEFFEQYSVQTLNDPIRAMDMFAIFEMLCDWVAASKRRGNSPVKALDFMMKKYPIDEQLEAILRNTLAMIESA